jgi:hypothetical protein
VGVQVNWRSTKFLTTLLIIGLSFIGMMYGKIGGSEWGTITVFALGLYAHHDVKQKEVINARPS